LPLTLELARNGDMPLLSALSRVTSSPADLLKLPGGRLAKGQPADLVIFDVDETWVVDPDKLQSKSKNTPFEGRTMTGRAHRTVVDGRTVYSASGAAPAG
ncbi:MAG: amidohydrolase family protein, partial [Alphaproteobacteria bacterium]|nr:amidohydrolase family protein [Alphaproteobacteria bacterium]